MVWSLGSNAAICSPNSTTTLCSPGMLQFLMFVTEFMGYSYDNQLNTTHQHEFPEYDFIIVGGGSAGCVLANRLSEISDWKILLLEAGDEEPKVASVPGLTNLFQKSSIDYDYMTQPETRACQSSPGRSCEWPRGKVLGGSSSINGMLYVRGNKFDYDNWERLGNTGWSWKDVLPYFKKSEDMKIPEVLEQSSEYHSTGGYQTVDGYQYQDEIAQAVRDAWKELGFEETDYNNGAQIGTSKVQFSSVNGARQSANGAFIRPIRGLRKNLVIRTDSQVKKVIINKRTKRALGVEYTDKRGKVRRAFARKEVILSAGAIDSPRLLMLSGIGPREELEEAGIDLIKDLPVGENLQDHVLIAPILIDLQNKTRAEISQDRVQNDLLHWLSAHKGPMADFGFLDVQTWFATSYEKQPNVPDIQMNFVSFLTGDSKDSYNILFPYYDKFLMSTNLVATKSRGVLKLNKTDPLGSQPMIYANYFSDPQDMAALIEGARISNAILNTTTFRRNGFVRTRLWAPACDHFQLDSDQYYECFVKHYMSSGLHPVGTCKMGSNSDREAVVNPRLRVHGIKGLRVIDASIIPVIPRGNTNAPTIMIGEKGSDMIKQDWLKNDYIVNSST
ncbi:hypothetical protein TSAR_002528 [Trichomalopsis sarcophagae]|uniref:Glucose-methanol-choline oxidoreductase N-terminal domain-containing protein n=1 Tax=Trichomalopsis sarcophagae TaxID=543379 RepID=A0A232FLV0_9HYME|nr:hypothetical protein TSAR_002528 [Trichomalopsis sarcophagae]